MREVARGYRGDLARNEDGSYTAEGMGQCGHCQRLIKKGQKFWWRRSTPASTECQDCRDERLVRSKVEREVKG